MKIEYDVSDVPKSHGNSKYVGGFYSFLESNHKNAKCEFDTEEEATKAYKAFHNAKSLRRIDGVKVTRVGKIVYVSKTEDYTDKWKQQKAKE